VVVLLKLQLLIQLLLKLLQWTLLLLQWTLLLQLLIQLLLLLLKLSKLFFIWQAIVEVVPFSRNDFFYLVENQLLAIFSVLSAPLKLSLQK
jgi:hypothetical protein